jgi:hypothetical protein
MVEDSIQWLRQEKRGIYELEEGGQFLSIYIRFAKGDLALLRCCEQTTATGAAAGSSDNKKSRGDSFERKNFLFFSFDGNI